eukprot:Sspe_Gene.95836::Locus_68150_Transcript_1_1_Confidence_1.000_Length_1078::g.95836::m.95836
MDTLGGEAAIEHAECPICFEPQCIHPVAVFLNPSGRRLCQHYFHYQCVQALPDNLCPMCRRPISEIRQLPDPIESTAEWFTLVDCAGDGRLSKKEVTAALKACLNVDESRVGPVVEEKWEQWDPNKSGYIERGDIHLALVFIKSHLPSRQDGKDVPVLQTDRASKQNWFDYWDRDASGSLSIDEMARALIKTFRPENEMRQREIISSLRSIWGIFDTDGDNTISMEEFATVDGFGDTILATYAYSTPAGSPFHLSSSPSGGGRPHAPPAGTDSSAWNCRLCTFRNEDPQCFICTMCDTPRYNLEN